MLAVWSTIFDADEFPVLSTSEDVHINPLPVLTAKRLRFGNEEILREALRDDLIIISASGHNPSTTVRGLIEMVGENEWRQRNAKVVFRTQDSHHQLHDELEILDEVDLLAVAHSNYLRYFPAHKVLHVPCSLHQNRSAAAQWLKEIPISNDVDVVFPFQLYRGESRNALSYEVWKKLTKQGFSVRFGFFRYFQSEDRPPVLWEELARARVILNLPLRNDFNIRNLEASLFPSWHVTPQLPDHDLVTMDWSNTRFVEPNASEIVSAVEEIFHLGEYQEPSLAPQEMVLQHHTASDRIYQIIDATLGTRLDQQPKYFGGDTEQEKKPAIVTIYSGSQLLDYSPNIWSKAPSNALYTPSALLRLKATMMQLVLLPGRVLRKLKRH